MATPKYAGFWIRFVAEMIDNTILSLVVIIGELILIGMIYWIFVLKTPTGETPRGFLDVLGPVWIQVIYCILYALLSIPYYTYWHFQHGTTIGKKMLGIYVVNEKNLGKITLKQSLIRCFGYAVSSLPLSAGYIMAAFHPEKRALHDLMAGTVSIIRPKSRAA
ncbi:MAG: RDD family protein [Bdellovibrionota bacterium]